MNCRQGSPGMSRFIVNVARRLVRYIGTGDDLNVVQCGWRRGLTKR